MCWAHTPQTHMIPQHHTVLEKAQQRMFFLMYLKNLSMGTGPLRVCWPLKHTVKTATIIGAELPELQDIYNTKIKAITSLRTAATVLMDCSNCLSLPSEKCHGASAWCHPSQSHLHCWIADTPHALITFCKQCFVLVCRECGYVGCYVGFEGCCDLYLFMYA